MKISFQSMNSEIIKTKNLKLKIIEDILKFTSQHILVLLFHNLLSLFWNLLTTYINHYFC